MAPAKRKVTKIGKRTALLVIFDVTEVMTKCEVMILNVIS